MLGGLVVVGGLAEIGRVVVEKDGLASVQRVARINGAVLLTHVMRAIIHDNHGLVRLVVVNLDAVDRVLDAGTLVRVVVVAYTRVILNLYLAVRAEVGCAAYLAPVLARHTALVDDEVGRLFSCPVFCPRGFQLAPSFAGRSCDCGAGGLGGGSSLLCGDLSQGRELDVLGVMEHVCP